MHLGRDSITGARAQGGARCVFLRLLPAIAALTAMAFMGAANAASEEPFDELKERVFRCSQEAFSFSNRNLCSNFAQDNADYNRRRQLLHDELDRTRAAIAREYRQEEAHIKAYEAANPPPWCAEAAHTDICYPMPKRCRGLDARGELLYRQPACEALIHRLIKAVLACPAPPQVWSSPREHTVQHVAGDCPFLYDELHAIAFPDRPPVASIKSGSGDPEWDRLCSGPWTMVKDGHRYASFKKNSPECRAYGAPRRALGGVEVMQVLQKSSNAPSVMLKTDHQGFVKFHNTPPGQYRYTARCPVAARLVIHLSSKGNAAAATSEICAINQVQSTTLVVPSGSAQTVTVQIRKQ